MSPYTLPNPGPGGVEKKPGRTQRNEVAAPRRGSPPALAATGAVFLLLGVLALRQVGSLDAGFHLEAGRFILEGHGFPRTDPFSYTMTDHAYVDTSWGYQVLVALVHRAAGAVGLTLFHAALTLATFLTLLATIRLGPAPFPIAVPGLALGVLAAEMRYQARPEVLSYALLAGLLYLLHRHAAGRRAPLWLLPPLFLLWINVHALFVVGFVALVCFVVGLAWRDRRVDRALLACGAAALAAGLVNPYGLRGLTFPLTLATRLGEENVFGQSIGEFVSPFALRLSEQFPFYPRAPIFSFRVLFVLVVVSLWPLWRQRRFVPLVLALPFLLLSASMLRNVPLLVVTALPGVVWGLGASAPRRRTARDRRGLHSLVALVVGIACVVLALRVAHDAYYVASRRVERFGWGWNRLALPLHAAAWVERAEIHGPMLNYLSFGGYLMWALPDPVFIDGRLEVVGEEFYERYRKIFASVAGIETAVSDWGVRWVVFPYLERPDLLDGLSRDPRWRLAYVDHLAVIFVREGPDAARAVHPSVPAETGGPLAAARIDDLPGTGAVRRAGGGRRWLEGVLHRQRFPSEAFGLGLFHYFRQDPARAAPRFAAAIRESTGAYFEIYANLGAALYRLGRLADADACYGVVLQDDPQNALARRRLDEIRERLARAPAGR
jgi:hypothetical protein